MIYPINHRQTNCTDLKQFLKYDNQNVDDLIATFEDNVGYEEVYINLDKSKSYKAHIYEGDFSKQEEPYKRILCYPYKNKTFDIGQYITYFDDYNDEIITIMDALDNQNLDGLVGHLYKCNNLIKWYDKYNNLIEYPCVFNTSTKNNNFDYNQNVDIVSGIAKVKVQYNEDTRLIEENDRFVFNGIPYKVTETHKHFQTNVYDSESVGVLTLDILKDTASPDDDLINNIANVNKNRYILTCDMDEIKCNINAQGKINYTLLLDDIISNETISFKSSDETVIQIDELGNYTSLKEGNTIITCYMVNNENIKVDINAEVSSIVTDTVEINVLPDVNKILQGKTKTFTVHKIVNGVEENELLTIEDISSIDNNYYTLTIDNNSFSIKNIRQYKNDTVNIKISDSDGNELIKNYTLGSVV